MSTKRPETAVYSGHTRVRVLIIPEGADAARCPDGTHPCACGDETLKPAAESYCSTRGGLDGEIVRTGPGTGKGKCEDGTRFRLRCCCPD